MDGISIIASGIPLDPPMGRVTPVIEDEFRRQGHPVGGVAAVTKPACVSVTVVVAVVVEIDKPF